jgi:hypothetical protein
MPPQAIFAAATLRRWPRRLTGRKHGSKAAAKVGSSTPDPICSAKPKPVGTDSCQLQPGCGSAASTNITAVTGNGASSACGLSDAVPMRTIARGSTVCEVEAGTEGLDAHFEVAECRRPYEP